MYNTLKKHEKVNFRWYIFDHSKKDNKSTENIVTNTKVAVT